MRLDYNRILLSAIASLVFLTFPFPANAKEDPAMGHYVNLSTDDRKNNMTEKKITPYSFGGKTLVSGLAILGLASGGAMAQKMPDHGAMDHGKLGQGMRKTATMKKSPAIKVGDLSIRGPWARQSFGKAVNSAGFMIIDNKGAKDDMLIEARSTISKRTELHTHIRDGDIMRMRRVEGGIAVPKGGQAKLAPGGFHVMFIGLQQPLKKGDTFPLTLTFKNAGEVAFNITARKMAMPKGMKMDHGKMHRGSH